jgi:ATP-dependent RNA helicase DHX57
VFYWPFVNIVAHNQNFISASTVRDITSLRHDFLSALNQIGFIGTGQAELAKYSVNSTQENLIKSVLVGGLYPRVARIAMPKALFERVQQGAVQKDVCTFWFTGVSADDAST